jgi:hypothetical protein
LSGWIIRTLAIFALFVIPVPSKPDERNWTNLDARRMTAGRGRPIGSGTGERFTTSFDSSLLRDEIET